MHSPRLSALEVEALTFIYTPRAPREDFEATRRKWALRARTGTGAMALAWIVVAGLGWVEFAARTVPESYGL